MRILLTYFTFPPSANGVARFLGDTTTALLEKGHKVEILAGDVDKLSVERKGNLRIHRVPFYSIRLKENNREITKKYFSYLIKIHKNSPIDIIEAQGLIGEFAFPYALALNMFSITYNVPLVLRFHGMAINDLQRIMAKNLFWNKIISVCNCGTEAIYSAGIPIERLDTQHNGTDLKNFRPELGKKWLRSRIDVSNNDFVVGTASRIISPLPYNSPEEDRTIIDKGITDLIKAFGSSFKDNKEAKLVIACATPPEDLRDRFEKVKKRLLEFGKINGIRDRIIIKEFSLEEMPLFYNGLDLFVLASHSEAFPMVLLEAGACKIPVVSTTVGGIPELITNGENGFLVEPKDTVSLGKILRELSKSPEKREVVAENAYRIIKSRYGIRKIAEKTLGIYKSIIDNKQKTNNYLLDFSDAIKNLEKISTNKGKEIWGLFKGSKDKKRDRSSWEIIKLLS